MQEFRESRGDTFEERHIATWMCLAEVGEKTHEADWSDGAHHAKVNRGVVHMEELRRCRFGRLGLSHHLLEMWTHKTPEICEMRQVVLTPQQQSAELFLELVDGTRQRRL